jgi:hypothetical protein
MEVRSFLEMASNISVVASFMPVIFSIINYKYIPKYIFPLFLLIIISGVVDVVNSVYVEMELNNSPIFHLFTVVEFFLISIFYYRFLKQYFNSVIILIFIPLFFVAAFIDYKINGLNSMDNFSLSIESIILSVYALFLFYFILKNLLFENLLNSNIFWFNAAILFYFSGNLILFVFSNYIIETSMEEHYTLWGIIHSFFNIMYNVFLSIGFWKTRLK